MKKYTVYGRVLTFVEYEVEAEDETEAHAIAEEKALEEVTHPFFEFDFEFDGVEED